MAEMNIPAGNNRHKGTRSQRKSTRVDMTPMVDLGFLLITFFMLTTTLAQPRSMQLNMPRKDGEPMKIRESGALTLLPGPGNSIAWYNGIGDDPAHPPQVFYTSFAQINGLRKVLLEQKQQTGELTVLIKPHPGSSYRNMVDILDEMQVLHIDRYVVADISAQEEGYFSLPLPLQNN